MALAKKQPRFAVPTDYEDDFEQWCFEQAELLRQKRFAELDLSNLIEEIEAMGKEQRRALKSSYRLLIAHLLKWQFQPQLRSRSWEITIDRERDNIDDREKDNPSLAQEAKRIVEGVYRRAVREAAKETELPRSDFPFDCPYTVEQLRDPDWMPDEPA
jgi:hypothetical protein